MRNLLLFSLTVLLLILVVLPTETECQTTENNDSTIEEFNVTSAAPTTEPQLNYQVSTEYGSFIGITYSVTTGSNLSSTDSPFAEEAEIFATKMISKFVGIPYAQPPTGQRRFQPPVAIPASNTTRNATDMPPNCPQPKSNGTSEDCLYLNIWTPQTADNANSSKTYPVIVWIHGGKFESGGSNDGLTDGEQIVTFEYAVVVTFNYRLGALGFLPLGAANLGIQDQRLAIEVISKIAPSFGGDVSKLTLMGLDAGSASIGLHMMNNTVSGLFSRAIMMGGSPMMPWALVPNTEYYKSISQSFASSAGCNNSSQTEQMNCLQSLTTDRIMTAQQSIRSTFPSFHFSTYVDGTVVNADPWHSFSVGNFTSKPLLIGATNDEGARIALDNLAAQNISVSQLNDENLQKMVVNSLPFYPRANQNLTAYGREFLQLQYTNRGGFNDSRANFKLLSDAIGDWYLLCPVLGMAMFTEAAAGSSSSNSVYMYYFTEKEIRQNDWNGASHGVDAKYAFGIPTKSSETDYSAEKKTLSQTVMRQFVSFANTTVPEQNESLWKQLNYTAGEINYVFYISDSRLLGNQKLGFRIPECHFWNRTLGYVNSLDNSAMTTPIPTTRNPIGSETFSCAWAFTETAILILVIMTVALVITGAALIYFIMRSKKLAKFGSNRIEGISM